MATTVDDVRAILPTSTALTDLQIQAAIDAATCVVDEAQDDCNNGLSDACWTIVCTYLSAHFAAGTENTLSLVSETDPCSGGKVVYGFQFGEGIKGTPYGQTANTISRGCLQEWDKRPFGLLAVGTIGQNETDIFPYVTEAFDSTS